MPIAEEPERTLAAANYRPLQTIPETREILGGIGETRVYELVHEGKLTLVKIGRLSRITTASINQLIETLPPAILRRKPRRGG
jgi:excisionase family DNA binding protein